MEPNLKQRGNPKGPTSALVAQNVRRVRNARRLDLKGLSERIGALGWPISVAALSRLENGERRVDVDDLVALSAALNVSPLDLLFPIDDEGVEIGTAIPSEVSLAEVRAWGRGDTNLEPEALIQFWQREVESALVDIEYLEKLRGAEDRKARAMAARSIPKFQDQLSRARDRIDQLERIVKSGA